MQLRIHFRHPAMPTKTTSKPKSDRREFFEAVRNGVLIGVVALLVALPAMKYFQSQRATLPNSPAAVQQQPPAPSAQRQPAPILASFGDTDASSEARQVATWAFHTRDNQGKAVVVIDKAHAKVFVFNTDGQLKAATPALLGSAKGDDSVPGIGELPLSQVTPEMRTTPAGRYVAEPGVNANGEDIIWVDYNVAVSMHRVRPNVKAERRLERLASPTVDDNRISYGCVNLPVAFYEQVLSPTVKSAGAIIYVLPETTTAARLFGSYDIPLQQFAQK
jgi:hypothetical protein